MQSQAMAQRPMVAFASPACGPQVPSLPRPTPRSLPIFFPLVSQQQHHGSDLPSSIREQTYMSRRPSRSRMNTSMGPSLSPSLWGQGTSVSCPSLSFTFDLFEFCIDAMLIIGTVLQCYVVPLATSLCGATTSIHSREATSPMLYWLAVLDVFNAGDSLPCQTNGNTNSEFTCSNNGWRVAITLGHILIVLTYEFNSVPPYKSWLVKSGHRSSSCSCSWGGKPLLYGVDI